MSTGTFSTATERDALCSFLDQARDALIRKVAGLSDQEARASPTVSSLSVDLDARCARTDLVDQNLRWVAMHLIQETARHAGHADIIREAIDGSRGL